MALVFKHDESVQNIAEVLQQKGLDKKNAAITAKRICEILQRRGQSIDLQNSSHANWGIDAKGSSSRHTGFYLYRNNGWPSVMVCVVRF